MSGSAVPTVELEDPGGRRVTVAPCSTGDRIGELADALGVAPDRPVLVDGRPASRHETLAAAGLVRGSRLATGRDPDEDPEAPPATPGEPRVVVVVEAGPDAGASHLLPLGRHVVGRAPSVRIPIDDPLLEPHHALLDVAGDGTVHLVQLAGRVPALLVGEPIAGRTALRPGDRIVIGATRLRIDRSGGAVPTGGALTPAPTDPWRRTLVRAPRSEPRWAPDPIPVPVPPVGPPPASATGLAATLLVLAGSIAMAVVMRSPLFLALASVSGLASLGVWLGGRLRAGRAGRRAERARQRDLAAFASAVAAQRETRRRYHDAVAPPLWRTVAEATSIGADVWARRAGHPDAFTASLGWGPVSWDVVLDGSGDAPLPADAADVVSAAEHFAESPVAVDLGPDAAVAVTGPGSRSLARSLIVQLATWTGPADWRLLVVAADPDEWDWCRWLPHTAAAGTSLVVAADDGDRLTAALRALADHTGGHVVLVTDRPDLLALRTGAVRRFLGARPAAAVLVTVPGGHVVPALCRSALEIGSLGLARWRPVLSAPAAPGRVHVAGLTGTTATLAARRLAALHDPEDASVADAGLPAAVTLAELSADRPLDDAIAIAGAWRSAGPDPAPAAAIGLTGDGVVEIDLARDGPHALVAGTTGAGKSELLRTLVVSLAARSSPDHMTFVLVDYKGGATFDACADLPHTVGVVTDLDERLAERALVSLEAELRRRERRLRAAGADDLRGYRAVPGEPPLPRLVVVIDEFATLAAELPGFLPSLVGIAQRGRSLGLHLVLATQRPAGVVDGDIRANTNLRLALRLQDPADGRDVVGDPAPATFPRQTPGRAMLRLGPGETIVFQAATSSGPAPTHRPERLRVVGAGEEPPNATASELDVLVGSIRQAAALCDIRPPHRPWLPPLPPRLDPGTLAPGAAGVVDDPAGQCRQALRWAPDDGHLALLGAVGTGTTTAVMTVVAALARQSAPGELHVYVIDASGDERLDTLRRLPHCGAVVRPHERERLARLLRRVVGDLDARRADGGRGKRPHVVVAVDGLAALRGALDAAGDELGLLARILAEGPAVGVSCVLTAERPGAVPPSMLAACSERWLFRLDDPAEGPVGGVPAAVIPRAGPGRIVVASSGLEAQVAVLDPPAGGPQTGGPQPVGTLPADIDASRLPPGRPGRDGETELVVGLELHSLEPAVLTVPDGEHVVVAGPPRSGRSTALLRLAESWRDAHPNGEIHALAPLRRSPLAGWAAAAAADGVVDLLDVLASRPAGAPCLVLVDDAERVEDPRLTALVAERRPGLLVVAAGRPDALRMQYGEWTNVVRRSRLGLLMSACADTDGDVLGELLPRRPPLPPRPGLAWVVGAGQRALVQVGRRLSRP